MGNISREMKTINIEIPELKRAKMKTCWMRIIALETTKGKVSELRDIINRAIAEKLLWKKSHI